MKLPHMLALIAALWALSFTVKAEISDPTRPLTFQEALQMRCSQGSMLLQSINYGPEEQTVLINGKFYEVGDKVDLYVVSAITPDSVILERGSEKMVLTLG